MGFLKELIIGEVVESVVDSIPRAVGGVLSEVDKHKKRQSEIASAEAAPEKTIIVVQQSDPPKPASLEPIKRICECCGAPLEASDKCRYCGTEYRTVLPEKTKFCKHCAAQIPEDAVLCTHCGRQVEEIRRSEPPDPSTTQNVAPIVPPPVPTQGTAPIAAPALKKSKSKWTAFFLCLFLGEFGAHKFYEGKMGMGFAYLFTVGFCGIGWLIDIFVLLSKPNPYYV